MKKILCAVGVATIVSAKVYQIAIYKPVTSVLIGSTFAHAVIALAYILGFWSFATVALAVMLGGGGFLALSTFPFISFFLLTVKIRTWRHRVTASISPKPAGLDD